MHVVPLLVLMLLILAACASQAPCIDGYAMPPEEAWIKESVPSGTKLTKVTYSRWVCTQRGFE